MGMLSRVLAGGISSGLDTYAKALGDNQRDSNKMMFDVILEQAREKHDLNIQNLAHQNRTEENLAAFNREQVGVDDSGMPVTREQLSAGKQTLPKEEWAFKFKEAHTPIGETADGTFVYPGQQVPSDGILYSQQRREELSRKIAKENAELETEKSKVEENQASAQEKRALAGYYDRYEKTKKAAPKIDQQKMEEIADDITSTASNNLETAQSKLDRFNEVRGQYGLSKLKLKQSKPVVPADSGFLGFGGTDEQPATYILVEEGIASPAKSPIDLNRFFK